MKYLALFPCLVFLCFCVQAAETKRLALVIGNDDYQHIGKLEKAVNDANTMARELKAAGFEVELQRDVNYRKMSKIIDAFASRIGGGDQVVVFYAGHGVQIKSGNYLLPVDLEKGSESEIERFAYSLDDLTAKLSDAKASFSLVLVDACRNNPIKVAGRSIGASRGLSAVEPPKGQMVVFSASRGQEALDKLSDKDNNPNGVFTREFVARMKKPGTKIQDLMIEVQDAVEGLAKSVNHEQRPAVYNESRGNFYFYGSGALQIINNSAVSSDPETETWNAASSNNTKAAYDVYLQSYPNGRYSAAAKIKILSLQQTIQNKTINKDGANNSSVITIDDPDTALWKNTEALGTANDYKNYLNIYPNGKFSVIAKQRLKITFSHLGPSLTTDSAVASKITLKEWRKAENRNFCAPLGLPLDGGYAGSPRSANFYGGWAVAFDLPGIRSAYGIAGTGGKGAPTDSELKRWPYYRAYDDGSAVGYGLSGRDDYSSNNSDGKGQESLAYMRIAGQNCSYNVWSNLGRKHLEKLISDLRILKSP